MVMLSDDRCLFNLLFSHLTMLASHKASDFFLFSALSLSATRIDFPQKQPILYIPLSLKFVVHDMPAALVGA